MNSDSSLSFSLGTSNGPADPGSWFCMEPAPSTCIYTGISSFKGINLGVIQTPSGSHFGLPDGSELPTVDSPWDFFFNTGMHGTLSTSVTVVTDDGVGNVTLDMSGWMAEWNGEFIPLGTGADAVVNCASTCAYGEIYSLDYNAIVPSGPFTGVVYSIHLEGIISQQQPTNSAPIAIDDSDTVDRKTAGRPYVSKTIDIVENDTDADGNGDIDRTTVAVQTNAINGATNIDPVTGNVTYTPNDDYVGPDSFTYTVMDKGGPEGLSGVLESNEATVSILVQNAVPIAVDDAVVVDVASSSFIEIDVTANDSDTDGIIDISTVVISMTASNGSTVVNPVTGVVTYTPVVGYVGQDTFTYTINDNDGATSNTALVTITVSNASVGVLDPNAYLIIATGNVTDVLIEPQLGQGSWFSAEVQPGQPLHTTIAGFNHLHLGELQPASSVPLEPNIDQEWVFFGNIGVHQTTTPVTILTDDGAGNVTLGFSGWDVSWNAIPSIPLGNGGNPEGIAIMTCYENLALLVQGDCSFGDEYVLEYTAIVPPGDPSGFGGVPYRLHMEGTVSRTNEPPPRDIDGDGITDNLDNCTLIPNPTQCDGDGDGYGNHCDADFNNDNIVSRLDIRPLVTTLGTANPITDLTCNGIVNRQDILLFRHLFGSPPGPSALAP